MVYSGQAGFPPSWVGFNPSYLPLLFQQGGSAVPFSDAPIDWSALLPVLSPDVRALLAMSGAPLPAHIAQGNLAASNPFAAVSNLDPRTAMFLGNYQAARPTEQTLTPAQLQQNIRETFGPESLPLHMRAENAFTAVQLAFMAALNGASDADLRQLLGRDNPGVRGLVDSIQKLAKLFKKQPPDLQAIARATAETHYDMIPYICRNDAERKLGEQFFKAFYGVGKPSEIKFNGQGPLGNMVNTMAPGAADQSGGNFGGPASAAGQNALQAAISQLGVREASGNNDGVPSQRYMDGRREPWCANFVSWCFRQAGHPLPGNQRSIASCDAMAAALRGAGRLRGKGDYTPKPGDVIFFGSPGDYTHVGIVERVANGRVYTVEGNTSDMVARRSYALNSSYVQSYGVT